MSPEQAGLTPTDVDTRTDVYALGVMLYELLVGAMPFEATTLRDGGVDQVRQMIREQEPVRPSTRVRRRGAAGNADADRRAMAPDRLARVLRGDLDAIVIKALEKDRGRRYPTANALALDVRRHLQDEPVTAGSPGAVYRAQKFVRRHRWSVAAVAVLLAMIGGFSVAMALQVRRTTRERDRANQEAATAQQVSDFLVGLFRVSDPSEARGTTLTARDILSKGAGDVERELGDQPRVRARIETTIGTVYTNLGMLKEAEPLLQRAVQTARDQLGPDHQDALTALNELANLYWFQSRFKEAEPLYHEVVQRRTRVLGADHRDTLHAQFDLASLYALQGRLAEAEQLMLATLATQRRVIGPDSADALSSMNNLQSVYFRQKRYAEAEALAVRVLAEQRRLHGPDHPETIDATHNLATIYEKLGKYAEAESLYVDAIDTSRRVKGPQHPYTVNSILALGRMYAAQRRFSEAERTLLEAYDLRVRNLGQRAAPSREVAGFLADLYAAASDSVKAAAWRKVSTE